MAKISAFVGHSFEDVDRTLVNKFLDHLDTFRPLGFEWVDAEEAESTGLANKVKAKMEEKNAFIGIFTKKYPIDRWFVMRRKRLDILRQSISLFLRPKVLFRNSGYNASPWIFQESGYGICKKMELLFLVEERIMDKGGLQGDLEYVFFSRENPEKSFEKINEIINKWLAKEYEVLEKPTTILELPRKPKEEKPEAIMLRKIYDAIFVEKNEEKADKLIESYISQIEERDEQIVWRTKFLSAQIKVGLKRIEDLFKLSSEFAEHPEPVASIGHQYGELGEFCKAGEFYLKSAEKESNKIGKIERICSAAENFGKAKKYDTAFEIILNELKSTDLGNESKFRLYRTMASLFEMKKDSDSEICFMEKALEINPFDYSLRFNLAYRYSEIGKENLALYHYKKVVSRSPSTGSWNNLGVSYDGLGLHGKSIEAYKESKNLGGTLAIANMAYRYIDNGFFEEAEEILGEAVKIENYHPNVAAAKARVEELKEDEENKERQILESYEPHGLFYKSYSEAYIDKQVDKGILDGRWETKHGEIEIKQTTNDFQGEGKHEKVDKLTTAILGERGKLYKNYKEIKLTGSIIGRSAKYELKIEEFSDIHKSKKQNVFTGLLVIDKDYNLLKALEKDSSGKETHYDLIKRTQE